MIDVRNMQCPNGHILIAKPSHTDCAYDCLAKWLWQLSFPPRIETKDTTHPSNP